MRIEPEVQEQAEKILSTLGISASNAINIFYLIPDFGKMKEAGLLQVISTSMNQSFFTLSLGIVAM